jgi:hypothetical protein
MEQPIKLIIYEDISCRRGCALLLLLLPGCVCRLVLRPLCCCRCCPFRLSRCRAEQADLRWLVAGMCISLIAQGIMAATQDFVPCAEARIAPVY